MVLNNTYDVIFAAILRILENELMAQSNAGVQDFNDEDDAETQMYIYESCIDLISAIAKIGKTNIAMKFDNIFPSMMSYLNPTKGIDDNISMIGCFGDVFNRVKSKEFVKQYQNELFKCLPAMIEYQDDEMNRNVAFLLAVMVKYSHESMAQFIPDIKTQLSTMFINAQLKATKENIIMAICVICQYTQDYNTLNQCLDQLFLQCPFIEDQAENKNAIKFLLAIAGLP